MPSSKRIGHYVVSTHWDREWYESFQDFRFRLVRMLDEVLDTMKRDPEFRYFQTDGQAILIEDYLEIRPEREPDIRALAEAGRLKIGPWYVMSDEFLVSGESLIRNLQMGLAVASRFGQPSRVGFVCDIFGHISQLPQILLGFSIDNAMLLRGVSPEVHGAMFRWQAPNGSEVISYCFHPEGGYANYGFKVRKIERHDEKLDLDLAVKDVCELAENEMKRCPTSSFLLFDGADHMEIEPQTKEILRTTNQQLDKAKIVHSNLDDFIGELREQQDRITNQFVGELSDSAKDNAHPTVLAGVLSSRVHLKQANARCEAQLCYWAEPFSTFAARHGWEYPTSYLQLAWRYLLQNHPHDSICGCSIDQVHKDMEHRFDQCYGIASHLTTDALQYIADRIDVPQLGEKDLALIVFNPSSEPIDGPIDLTLRFPSSTDAIYQEGFGYEPRIGFRLYDAAGNELRYQYVNQRLNRKSYRRPLRKFPVKLTLHEVDISVPIQVPAYGYTTLLCRPIAHHTRYLGSMAVDDHTIENELLRVAVNTNGTLKLTDKRTGESYDRLLTLEDRADIGDGWCHGIPINEQIYSSVTSNAQTALTADGVAKATLTIRVTMQLPQHFLFDQMVRSETLTSLVVTHRVTLRHSSDAVEVHTVVENTVRDHRLRVLLPSGADATTFLTDTAFDVVDRPIALPAENEQYIELELETKPQQSWTAVFDEKRGLAVVSAGLRESSVRDLPDRPIALTLLRSFIRAVMTSGNEGGQIQGRHEFRYRIIPLQGRPDAARLTRIGQQLAADVRLVQLEHRDVTNEDSAEQPPRELPLTHSFLSIKSPAAVVTAIHRRSEDESAVIRMFNPTNDSIDVALTTDVPSNRARLTDLEGQPGNTLHKNGNEIRIPIKAKQIATIQLTK